MPHGFLKKAFKPWPSEYPEELPFVPPPAMVITVLFALFKYRMQ
jgi:hypothetical protein